MVLQPGDHCRKNINTLELQKFTLDANDKVCVRVCGEIETTESKTNDVFYQTLTLAKDASGTILNETIVPDAGECITRIYFGGDGQGDFTVTIDGSVWGIFRNSYMERQALFDLQKNFPKDATLKIDVTNCGFSQNDYHVTVLRRV